MSTFKAADLHSSGAVTREIKTPQKEAELWKAEQYQSKQFKISVLFFS